MPRARSFVVAIGIGALCFAYVTPPAYAQDPDYVLAFTEAAGYVGGTVEVRVTLTSSGSFITGFQFAVCDDALADTGFSEITLGPALEERIFDTLFTDFGSDYWSFAATFTSGFVLSASETHPLMVANYEMLAEGASELTFCDSLLEPKVIIEGGDEIEPVAHAGEIAILKAPEFLRGDVNGDGRIEPLLDAFFLGNYWLDDGPEPPCLEAADVDDNLEVTMADQAALLSYVFEGGAEPGYPGAASCGSEPGGGDLGCAAPPPCPSDPPSLVTDGSVLLSFGEVTGELDDAMDFQLSIFLTVEESAIQGIQFGVCHDAGLAIPEYPAPATAIGAGADTRGVYFLSSHAHPGGFTAGVLPGVSSSYAEFEPGEYELFVVTYSIEEDGVWTIEFCDGLGDPPIEARALRDMELLLPELGAPAVIEGNFKKLEGVGFSDKEGSTGDTVDVSVLISNLHDPLDAWHWGVCHDDLVSIDAGDVVAGEALAGLVLASHAINFESGGWTAAAVLDLDAGATLAPGFRQKAYVATYTLGSASGESILRVCDTLGDPHVPVGWVVGSEEVTPASHDGTITILPAIPFTYAVNAPLVYYDPAAIPDDLEFAVELTVEENSFYPGYPHDTLAFAMGVAHDGAVLELRSVEFTGKVAALNGGTGPAFHGINAETSGDVTGVTVGLIYSFEVTALQFEEEEPVVRVEYALTKDALTSLNGSSEGISTSLTWSDELGSPIVENKIAYHEGNVDLEVSPALEHGTVNILPGKQPIQFLRGDCNGSGDVSPLTDGSYLLLYGFLDGDPPPCFDAADVDDSGSISVFADSLYLLNWGYLGGSAPPAPGTETCGADPSKDSTECETISEDCE